jgi:hypothetical protein
MQWDAEIRHSSGCGSSAGLGKGVESIYQFCTTPRMDSAIHNYTIWL